MSKFSDLLDSMPEADAKLIHDRIEAVSTRRVSDAVKRTKLVAEIRAGPLRCEACEFEGKVTYTMCFNNDLMAWMGENAAVMFAGFVTDTQSRRPDTALGEPK